VDKKGLIVFIKQPQKGKVKTRLAQTLGDDFALAFYKACAEHTFSVIDELNASEHTIFIFYSGVDKRKITGWVNRDFIFKRQKGNDLGERMMNSFEEVFKHGVKNAVIIGSDIPGISLKIINSAFIALENSDIVIGPSKDGGYYLLGMKKINKNIFEGINWSSEKVFSQTMFKLEQKFKIKVLKELIDIDTENDLDEWMKISPENPLNIKIKKLLG
jgi:rSAM/selenodomain-associated transferase 1